MSRPASSSPTSRSPARSSPSSGPWSSGGCCGGCRGCSGLEATLLDRDKSYLPGRNQEALSEHDKQRVLNAFEALGYNGPLNILSGHSTKTEVKVIHDPETQIANPCIFVGSDIFPGVNVLNPNQRVDYVAAAAHEIMHCQRINNKSEIDEMEFAEIEEAITSLHAACAFRYELNPSQIEQLISDAAERLMGFVFKSRSQKVDGTWLLRIKRFISGAVERLIGFTRKSRIPKSKGGRP